MSWFRCNGGIFLGKKTKVRTYWTGLTLICSDFQRNLSIGKLIVKKKGPACGKQAGFFMADGL